MTLEISEIIKQVNKTLGKPEYVFSQPEVDAIAVWDYCSCCVTLQNNEGILEFEAVKTEDEYEIFQIFHETEEHISNALSAVVKYIKEN